MTNPLKSLCDENFFVFAFFLCDCSRFLLCVGVVGEFWRTRWDRAAQQQLLEVVENGAVLLCDEGYRCAFFASTTRSTNTMRVVCNTEPN